MSLSPDREKALLEAATRSKGAAREAACRELFEALRPQVWAICLRLCGERSLAEDALQNTFLATFRFLKSFRAEARLSTWVFRVAIREALALRAKGPPPSEGVDRAERLAADAPAPDAIAQARERARRTVEAFGALNPAQQTVLGLFAIDGLSHRQVAEVLGVPEGTAWYRLHEARKALSERLAALEAPKVFSAPASK